MAGAKRHVAWRGPGAARVVFLAMRSCVIALFLGSALVSFPLAGILLASVALCLSSGWFWREIADPASGAAARPAIDAILSVREGWLGFDLLAAQCICLPLGAAHAWVGGHILVAPAYAVLALAAWGFAGLTLRTAVRPALVPRSPGERDLAAMASPSASVH